MKTTDRESFAERFEPHREQLRRLCQRILGEADGARDAVSETYLRAFGRRAVFDGVNWPGWLSAIARHVCIDRLRRESRDRQAQEGIEPVSTDSEARMITAIQIRSILARLPEGQRRCLKLFYIEGLSAKEVASHTGYSDKQVKSHLQNGRRNFIQTWKDLEGKSGH